MKPNSEAIVISLLLVIAGNTSSSATISCGYYAAAIFVFIANIFNSRPRS